MNGSSAAENHQERPKPAPTGATHRVVATALSIVVISGLGYGLVVTTVQAAGLFTI